MVKEVELAPGVVVQKEIPQQYRNLFEIDPELREKMKGLSLGMVVLNCVLGLLNLKKENGRLSFDERQVSVKNIDVVVKRQIDSYQQVVKNVVLPTLEVGLNLASFTGGAVLRGVCKGGEAAIRGVSSNLESQHQAANVGFEHIKKGHERFVEFHKKGMQTGDQNEDRLLELWKEKQRADQEAFRSSAAAAA